MPRAGYLLVAAAALTVGGCSIILLPQNVNAEPPSRVRIRELPAAAEFAEPGVDDATWLECYTAVGPVGGYLVQPAHASSRDLVLMIAGASTYEDTAAAQALKFLRGLGSSLTGAGLSVWCMRPSECGTAWGREDADEVRAALRWLADSGREALGVERVMVLGYSTGATVALHMAFEPDVDGVVVLSGLCSDDQIARYQGVLEQVATLYPNNRGICHAAATLAAYGPAHSPGWQVLNAPARVGELRAPLLVMHGLLDFVFEPAGAIELHLAYLTQRARGAALPPADFVYVPDGTYFSLPDDPLVQAAVVAWLRAQR